MAVVIPHHYETCRVDELSPHPDNPNRGDPDAIAESIEAIGFFGVVLVQQSTGRIIAGEHRWLAAQQAGLKTLPVLMVDADDELVRKILLADNVFARMAFWDEEALVALLTEMDATGAGLVGSGISADDFSALLARQAEGLPEGFRHLTPRDPGDLEADADERMITCPHCGHEFALAGQP